MKPSRAKRQYKITYLDHELPVVQWKWLISHDDYLNIIEPLRLIIYTIEKDNRHKPTEESKQMKKLLVDLFGEVWFTDKSPLGGAIGTNKLTLPEHQGGIRNVKMEKVKS